MERRMGKSVNLGKRLQVILVNPEGFLTADTNLGKTGLNGDIAEE